MKRKNIRLTEYDYSQAGAYFITICTQNRQKLFWQNVGAIIDRPEDVRLSEIGNIVREAVANIPVYYPSICMDTYAIMPDHVHLLLQIDGRSLTAPTISRVVQQFKGAVTKQAGHPVWQKGFYDHVVRSEQDHREIWAYIEGNPMKWDEDHE